jgi:hypothetical protein
MNWEYRGRLAVSNVNYHVWQATEHDGNLVYAVSRTSIIPPQRPVVFKSLPELVARLGAVIPLEGMVPKTARPRLDPPNPEKPHGLYRRPGGWVEVNFLDSVRPVPPALYAHAAYWPPYEALPTREEYEAPVEVVKVESV